VSRIRRAYAAEVQGKTREPVRKRPRKPRQKPNLAAQWLHKFVPVCDQRQPLEPGLLTRLFFLQIPPAAQVILDDRFDRVRVEQAPIQAALRLRPA
jgi:hypothetical protein